jgi:phosphoglycerate dehydrogenase-like enzyme
MAEASDGQDIDWKTLHGNDLLLHHPRVIVTPHCAFFTLEAGQRLMDETVKNILAFAKGKPRNIVV